MPFELKEDPELDKRAKEIMLGGRPFKVYPLLLRQTLALVDLGQPPDIDGNTTSKSFDFFIDAVTLALRRAYPGATRDDIIDSEATLMELIAAYPVILSQGGAERSGAGERTATGTSPSGHSTGEGSSPTS